MPADDSVAAADAAPEFYLFALKPFANKCSIIISKDDFVKTFVIENVIVLNVELNTKEQTNMICLRTKIHTIDPPSSKKLCRSNKQKSNEYCKKETQWVAKPLE